MFPYYFPHILGRVLQNIPTQNLQQAKTKIINKQTNKHSSKACFLNLKEQKPFLEISSLLQSHTSRNPLLCGISEAQQGANLPFHPSPLNPWQHSDSQGPAVLAGTNRELIFHLPLDGRKYFSNSPSNLYWQTQYSSFKLKIQVFILYFGTSNNLVVFSKIKLK